MIIEQKCGLKATCIEYCGCHDIDVQFEDGTIVYNKNKQAFLNRNIKHPNINANSQHASCLNETRLMNNGMRATCIAYRNANDIDLKFENGVIVTGRKKVDL